MMAVLVDHPPPAGVDARGQGVPVGAVDAGCVAAIPVGVDAVADDLEAAR